MLPPTRAVESTEGVIRKLRFAWSMSDQVAPSLLRSAYCPALPALYGFKTKVTLTVCATVVPSVMLVAVKVSRPPVDALTEKTATPAASVTADAGEIAAGAGPPDWARLTVFRGAGSPNASRIVTVTVDGELPSAATNAGFATTLDGVTFLRIVPELPTPRQLPDGKQLSPISSVNVPSSSGAQVAPPLVVT